MRVPRARNHHVRGETRLRPEHRQHLGSLQRQNSKVRTYTVSCIPTETLQARKRCSDCKIEKSRPYHGDFLTRPCLYPPNLLPLPAFLEPDKPPIDTRPHNYTAHNGQNSIFFTYLQQRSLVFLQQSAHLSLKQYRDSRTPRGSRAMPQS